VVHRRLLPIPCLEWGHVIHALHRKPIQHIYNSTHRFTPESSGKALDLQHAPSSCHHRAILVLDDAILLQVVGHCVLMMHALSHAVLRELPRGELASTVEAERPLLQARLTFHPRLDLLDSSRCMILGGDRGYPMYLLRSSTTSKKYLLPLGIASAIGPHKCSSSRHHLTRYSAFIRNEVRHCFST
jgi:hypothetical protein